MARSWKVAPWNRASPWNVTTLNPASPWKVTSRNMARSRKVAPWNRASVRIAMPWSSRGTAAKRRPQELLSDRHAACVQSAVFAEALERRAQVGAGGVCPALATGREADAEAAVLRAHLPANVVVCHVVLARRRALPPAPCLAIAKAGLRRPAA